MTHADAFLQAILDAPDDDAPRLLFADWLDENGDPDRAEFIRVQIALARPHPPAGLRRREQELLTLHEKEWAAPVRRIARGWTFRRGFIDEVCVGARAFAERAEELFRQAPIRVLGLIWRLRGDWQGSRSAYRLADCPQLAKLQSLDLSGVRPHVPSFVLWALLTSRFLTTLTSLRLGGCGVGDEGIRVLTRWPHLTRLTHLDLSGNGISGAGIRALALSLETRATGGDPSQLRSLRLDDNPIGEAGRRAVRASPILRRAADLSIAGRVASGLRKM